MDCCCITIAVLVVILMSALILVSGWDERSEDHNEEMEKYLFVFVIASATFLTLNLWLILFLAWFILYTGESPCQKE